MKILSLPFLKRHALLLLLVGSVSGYSLLQDRCTSCAPGSEVGNPLLGSLQAAEPELPKAPAWKLKDLEGKEVTNEDFKGKVVVIDFWATWCPPCRMMIPGMVELQATYGEKGLIFVGISLDEGDAVVKEFAKENKINYPMLMGTDEVVAAFGGIEGIPTSFLIDREGRIVNKHVGYMDKKDIEKQIKPLL